MSAAAAMNISQSGNQNGGANPFESLYNYMDHPFKLIFGFMLIVLITFANQVPVATARFFDSTLGRVVGLVTVIGITSQVGWIYGLLTALAFLLIINNTPLSPRKEEGFQTLIDKKVQRPDSRWFVERVLGEHTRSIVTDVVNTGAVQDLSNRGMAGR